MKTSMIKAAFVASLVLVTSSQAQEKSWLSDAKFYGDFRYRLEGKDTEAAANEKILLNRLRGRFGVKADIKDVKFDFRLASGDGGTSTNQDAGGETTSGSNYQIRIDRMSANLSLVETTQVTLGRMANQYVLANGNDLMWDNDLNFDGFSLMDKRDLGDIQLTTNLSRFVNKAETTSNARDGVYLNSLQIAAKFKTAEKSSLTATAGIYSYDEIKNSPLLKTGSRNSATGGNYNFDYQIAEVGLEYVTELAEKNFSLFASYIQNTAISDENIGYIAGTRFGKLSKKGDWLLGYDYRRLETDSTVGAFTDAVAFGGGTNGDSHRLVSSYQFGEAWNMNLNFIKGKIDLADGQTALDRNRVQLDFFLKF